MEYYKKTENLTSIYGLSNLEGTMNQKLIIDDTAQYNVKADENLDFCLTRWNIYTGTVNSSNVMAILCAP